VNIFAWAESGQILTESKFQGGNTVSQGTVEVYDAASGRLLLSGSTDGQGRFAFPVPEAARAGKLTLRLVIKAGEGHQAQWDLAPDDYLNADDAAPAAAPTPAAAAASSPPAAPAAAPADIQKLVDAAVEAKVAPLRRQLAELSEPGPGAAGILGGLGFLMGLGALYGTYRRR
jgi:nickel transport protein